MNEEKKAPFVCELCDYSTNRPDNYKRHMQTEKHLIRANEDGSQCTCACGNTYKYNRCLTKHQKVCTINKRQMKQMVTPELVIELIKDNTEIKKLLNELVKNGTSNTLVQTNSLHINNHKTFNLHFFLNETCKNAMNIMDFVESIQLQLSDLESVGELGYTQGISNIITNKLQALDVTQRPVHCTDQKRETIYVKDENKWEKEDEQKTNLRKVIRMVANKNKKLLPQFREKNPEYNNSKLQISDKYDKMVLEAMGGPVLTNDVETENRIIRNITKCAIIEKIG